jgi:hypothetical protein
VEYVPQLSSDRIAPYLIIDNFEYLMGALAEPSHHHPFELEDLDEEAIVEEEKYEEFNQKSRYVGRKRLMDKILKELVINCRINIILNTEREQAI